MILLFVFAVFVVFLVVDYMMTPYSERPNEESLNKMFGYIFEVELNDIEMMIQEETCDEDNACEIYGDSNTDDQLFHDRMVEAHQNGIESALESFLHLDLDLDDE